MKIELNGTRKQFSNQAQECKFRDSHPAEYKKMIEEQNKKIEPPIEVLEEKIVNIPSNEKMTDEEIEEFLVKSKRGRKPSPKILDENSKQYKKYYLPKKTIDCIERLATDNEQKTCNYLTSLISTTFKNFYEKTATDRAKEELLNSKGETIIDSSAKLIEQVIQANQTIRDKDEIIRSLQNRIDEQNEKIISLSNDLNYANTRKDKYKEMVAQHDPRYLRKN